MMINFIDLAPLNILTENSQPVWGSMTAQHMVEHLVQSVQLSNGVLEINDCMNPADKLPILKRILMSERPLPKNFVNTVIGEYLKPLKFLNIDEAVSNLNEELVKLNNYFAENPNIKPNNPTFGPLNKEEWMQFHKKHFTHHFTQFGLI